MAEPDSKKINLARQAKLLSISRTSLYRKQDHAWYEKDLLDMRLIDEIYTAMPFYGYRQITEDMRNAGRAINRKRVRRLMRVMDVHGICPWPNLSKLLHAKYVRPYLLRGLKTSHPDQVWAVDITFVRMRQGFMYLFVVVDLFSRYIVDYELSMTLDRQAFLGCLKRAFKQARPEIINSDQGGQFTNEDYIKLLQSEGIQISMDGRGRALDNIFVERFFRTLKYENIYLNEYETPRALRKGLNRYISFYNEERLHQSLDYNRPADYYRHPQMDEIAS